MPRGTPGCTTAVSPASSELRPSTATTASFNPLKSPTEREAQFSLVLVQSSFPSNIWHARVLTDQWLDLAQQTSQNRRERRCIPIRESLFLLAQWETPPLSEDSIVCGRKEGLSGSELSRRNNPKGVLYWSASKRGIGNEPQYKVESTQAFWPRDRSQAQAPRTLNWVRLPPAEWLQLQTVQELLAKTSGPPPRW